jgi:hypothetical protein
MKALKKNMIKKAMEQYKHIVPCSTTSSFKECFTIEGNRMYFWFNTRDRSTHVVSEEF